MLWGYFLLTLVSLPVDLVALCSAHWKGSMDMLQFFAYAAYFLIVVLKCAGLLGAIAMHTKARRPRPRPHRARRAPDLRPSRRQFNCRLRFRADDDDPARRLRPGDSLAA